MSSYSKLLESVVTLQVPHRTAVVAIGGFGGSGKTTLANRLKADLHDDTEIVSGDDFSVGQQAARCDDWASIDRRRLLTQVLIPLSQRKLIRYQQYDWPNNRLGEWRTIDQRSHLIVEGIGIIHPDLAEHFDLSVWIDCPLEVATERGRRRDRDEYGVDHDQQWAQLWSPNDRDYFERFRPNRLADMVLEEDGW